MIVVVPFTYRHPLTVAAAPPEAEWRNVSASPWSYWEVLCEVWARGESFVTLEHDVLWSEAVRAGLDCWCSWAVHPYEGFCHIECMTAWRASLGCTRFTRDLVRAVPDAVSNLEPRKRDWHNLCDGIAENLHTAGFSGHWHFPAVEHHHGSLKGLEALIGG